MSEDQPAREAAEDASSGGGGAGQERTRPTPEGGVRPVGLSSRWWWPSTQLGRVQTTYTIVVLLAFAAPCFAIALYAGSLTSDGWRVFGIALMVMFGAFIAGGLVGFLFALPRSVKVAGVGGAPGSWAVQPNTNLRRCIRLANQNCSGSHIGPTG